MLGEEFAQKLAGQTRMCKALWEHRKEKVSSTWSMEGSSEKNGAEPPWATT